MNFKKALALVLLVTVFYAAGPAPVYADVGRDLSLVLRGTSKTLGSVFQIPARMMTGGGAPFPFGIVTGAISGTAQAVGGTLNGAVDIARGAAPYAKYLVFL